MVLFFIAQPATGIPSIGETQHSNAEAYYKAPAYRRQVGRDFEMNGGEANVAEAVFGRSRNQTAYSGFSERLYKVRTESRKQQPNYAERK